MEKYNKEKAQRAIANIDEEIKRVNKDYLSKPPGEEPPKQVLVHFSNWVAHLKDKREIKYLELAVAELQEKVK